MKKEEPVYIVLAEDGSILESALTPGELSVYSFLGVAQEAAGELGPLKIVEGWLTYEDEETAECKETG